MERVGEPGAEGGSEADRGAGCSPTVSRDGGEWGAVTGARDSQQDQHTHGDEAGEARKSSHWVKAGCRDMHGQAQEHRVICSIAQARTRGSSQSLMQLPGEEGAVPHEVSPSS